MTDVLKYELKRRARGIATLVVGVGVYLLLIVMLFPSMQDVAGSIEQNYPEAIREAFSITSLSTVEGFLSAEVYQFVWLLMLGLYVIYVAGGIIADEVESGRIDILLATPVSRKRLLVEKFASVVAIIVVINTVTPLVVLAGVLLIGESIDVGNLFLVHLLSIPYLMVAGAIGLTLSVLFDRADIAQRGGLALLFMLFIVESVTKGTDVEWIGAISPTRYFNPTDVLVDGTVDLGGIFILLGVTIVLVLISGEWFYRSDV